MTGRSAIETHDKYLSEILDVFSTRTGLNNLNHEVKRRSDGDYLIIYLASPNERLFGILRECLESSSEDNPYRDRTTLKIRTVSPSNRLHLPETQRLRTVLSESLTVTRHSFEDDFFTRYIRSVSGDEDQIIANGNHLVFGRRGSGKSSLLAYFLHDLRKNKSPHAWVAMQAYTGRSDAHVIVDVLLEIILQLRSYDPGNPEFDRIAARLKELLDRDQDSAKQVDRLFPSIRRAVSPLADRHGRVVLFIDDIHVIATELQPALLSKLYSISRDNRTFLKVSGIEQFTKNWNPSTRLGLEPPGDVQVIRLDYNLTMPDKSLNHIQSILDAHARYCGLPNVKYICGDGVLPRLVWVAAAIPRDALNLFAQAIVRANVKDRKRVAITSINAAASQMAEDKMGDIEKDVSGLYSDVRKLLLRVRRFCITEKRKNAFLVEIQNDDPTYNRIKELIALRLLHVLHEGITPDQAGRRFIALMLDYGFYVGIRAARSVDLFQKHPSPLQAKDLRNLPIFPLSSE